MGGKDVGDGNAVATVLVGGWRLVTHQPFLGWPCLHSLVPRPHPFCSSDTDSHSTVHSPAPANPVSSGESLSICTAEIPPVGLLDLGNKSTGHPVNMEFQISNE